MPRTQGRQGSSAQAGDAAPAADTAKGTKERLLDAAEELFAAGGIHATSLRDITSLARANLAAVNYHFSSKEALVEAMFERRLDPLNEERIALLTRAEAAAGARPLPLEAILRAFFDPTVQLWRDHPHFMRLLGRLQFEPDQKLHVFYLSRFEEVLRRFKAAVTRTLPEIPLRELFWRMHFVVGAMVHTCTCHEDLEHISGGLCSVKPYQKTIDRLVAFGVAGRKAPRTTSRLSRRLHPVAPLKSGREIPRKTRRQGREVHT